jgi:DNA modification methylase
MEKDARKVALVFPGSDEPVVARNARVDLDPSVAVSLVQGENLAALSALVAALGPTAALVYFDPPFFTGRAHEVNGREARTRKGAVAFDDRWEDLPEYLRFLRARMTIARDLLRPDGSLVVHVDPKTSHYVRLLGDAVFGPRAFVSEIVWRYRRWPAKTKNFQRLHDVLLRFVRDPDVPPRFEQLYEPLAASTRAVWGEGKQNAVFRDGKRARSSTLETPSPGAPLGDVWDIGIVAPSGKERTGYPTQKPEALLERLLLALTRPGDLVIDPTLGSGTTAVVGARLGRRIVGIDQSSVSLSIARERLSQRAIAFSETVVKEIEERAGE